MVGAVRERYGRIDVLHANAGLVRAAALDAVTEEQFDEQVELKFRGLFFSIQKAAPLIGKNCYCFPTAMAVSSREGAHRRVG